MANSPAAFYRRWRIQAGIQTPETIGAFIKGVLTDCVHMDGAAIHGAAACALAALSAFEHATEPMGYDEAIAALDEVQRQWVDGK